ncbi:MAG TPA: hypothetical protein DCM28_17190 [Phycisphaerales bacterium]|nr:hypothetical protein [Phycisphaerales bacterium]HCD33801.1 hypothetical protein [Phycisphaerales bacterium]
MQFKAMLTTILAIAFLTGSVWAGQGRARIDLNVKSGELKITPSTDKNVRITHATWLKEKDRVKMYASSDLKVNDETWTQVSIEVTPSEDSTMTISLRGAWDKVKRNWCYYDDITVQGAKIVNSSFEEPKGWRVAKDQLVVDESLAHTGKAAVLVWHDKSANQSIQVKADVPVTISAWVKFCKQEDKESK